MKQDRHQRAKERYDDAIEANSEQFDRMREDLRFSNETRPQQWSESAIGARQGRPCLTLNRTAQFIRQIVNDGRANTPSIQVVPADEYANAKAAEKLNGRLRHIEYASRADQAYDYALEMAVRCGLGWLRVLPSELSAELNIQEPRIHRIYDSLAVVPDTSWTEVDGSDMEWGFVVAPMAREKFKLAFPKATDTHDWEDNARRWSVRSQRRDDIVVAEYFEIERTKMRKLMVAMPQGEPLPMTEDEYWEFVRTTGIRPQLLNDFEVEERKVTWSKMTGAEELEEIEFPSRYIPLVPVIGNELWVDGERFLSGLTRQLMDTQRMYNAEVSAYMEVMLSQPKAPFMADIRAIAGHEKAWNQLNTGNPSVLPYNGIDEDQQPVPPPQRMSPPAFPAAFANGMTMAAQAMESAVGMYKANLGQQSNETSGRAIRARQMEGDTATFHYADNRAKSLEHLGRILIDMDKRLTDTARSVRTMSESGDAGLIRFDPQMPDAVKLKGNDVEAVNPHIGEYDVRVKVGPAFLTQRAELSQQLADMMTASPQLTPVIGPLWAEMTDMPQKDRVRKILLAMAPPPVQQAMSEDDKEQQIPPQVQMHMQQQEQLIQQMQQAIEGMSQELEQAGAERERVELERLKAEADVLLRGYEAVTKRMQVTQNPALIQAPAVQNQTASQALALTPDGQATPPVSVSMVAPEPPEPQEQEVTEGAE